MRIFIKVKTNSAKPGIEKMDENNFVVRVKESPIKGMANEAVMNALAEYFKAANWRVKIIGGITSKNKIVEIN